MEREEERSSLPFSLQFVIGAAGPASITIEACTGSRDREPGCVVQAQKKKIGELGVKHM